MRSLNFVASVLFGGLLLLTGSCLDNAVDPDVQHARDVETIDAHLSAKGVSAHRDLSGLRFIIHSLGAGLPPRFDQEVKVKYKGMLLDGTVFEENSTSAPLTRYITGWQRAMPLFPKGTVATIYIPSDMAYGSAAKGPIPANAILVFDIELQDVIVTAVEKSRANIDVSAIDKYLSDNAITAVSDTTGLRYVLSQPGTGAKPGWYSKVKFTYTGKVLGSQSTFASGTSEPNAAFDGRMVDYIHGIMIGLSKLGVGGKGTFYIPSGLAFGSSETGPVPVNSNVVYEIELTEILAP
jgi:FKBP-type peptidyl-prolyl cis-trans isomerase FkpA